MVKEGGATPEMYMYMYFHWASHTLLRNSRYTQTLVAVEKPNSKFIFRFRFSLMGHAHATRCVYQYRVHLIAPTASGKVEP
jgi:hypothetical protein